MSFRERKSGHEGRSFFEGRLMEIVRAKKHGFRVLTGSKGTIDHCQDRRRNPSNLGRETMVGQWDRTKNKGGMYRSRIVVKCILAFHRVCACTCAHVYVLLVRGLHCSRRVAH